MDSITLQMKTFNLLRINLLRISINQYNKNKLKSTKIHVNESLYPYYCKLLGKCNSLLKRNLLKSLNTINGKLKIKYDLDSGEVSVVIAHEEDLLEIFGSGMMSRVESEHNPQWWVIIMVAIIYFQIYFYFYFHLRTMKLRTAELTIRKVLLT